LPGGAGVAARAAVGRIGQQIAAGATARLFAFLCAGAALARTTEVIGRASDGTRAAVVVIGGQIDACSVAELLAGVAAGRRVHVTARARVFRVVR
jgi:hypothetical protein